MALPADLKVQLFVKAKAAAVSVYPTWTDVTSSVLTEDGISIRRGRSGEDTQVRPQSCRLALKNAAGDFSPRNPAGAYFGSLGRNTELRVVVGTTPLSSTNSFSGTATGNHVSTSFTVPSNGRLVMYVITNGTGTWTAPTGFTLVSEAATGGYEFVTFESNAVATGTIAALTAAQSGANATEYVTSVVWLPGGSANVTAGALDSDSTGAALSVGPFTMASTDTWLAAVGFSRDSVGYAHPPVTFAYENSQWIMVSDSGISGSRPRIVTYAASTIAVSTQGQFQVGGNNNEPGPAVFLDVSQCVSVTDWRPRFCGEVADWPTAQTPKGLAVARVEASGVTRRLAKAGERSAISAQALVRANVFEHWPLEDGADATSFASLKEGGLPGTVFGSPTFSTFDSILGSASLPTFNAAGARLPVRAYTAPPTGEYQVVYGLAHIPSGGSTNGANLFSCEFGSGSTLRSIVVEYRTASSGSLHTKVLDDGGTLILDTTTTFTGVNGKSLFVSWSMKQNSANVNLFFSFGKIRAETNNYEDLHTSIEYDFISETLGPVVTLKAGLETNTNGVLHAADVAFGHVGFGRGTIGVASQWMGHWNDNAVNRLLRSCWSHGATAHYMLTTVYSARLGGQRVGDFLGNLSEIEQVDGYCYDTLGHSGVGVRQRESWSGFFATYTLVAADDQEIGGALAVVDDDQLLVNDVTARRPEGSSAREVNATSVAKVGRYQSTVEVNAQYDSSLPHHAGFRAHLGGWDEARWPQITLDLIRASARQTVFAGLDLFDRLLLQDMPTWVDRRFDPHVMIVGYEEFIAPGVWTITYDTVPYRPYFTTVLDAAASGRPFVGSGGSTLQTAVNTSATSLEVSTTPNTHANLWSYPSINFSIQMNNEVMLVTGIVTEASPQTFTVVRGTGGFSAAHAVGSTIKMFNPMILPPGEADV